MNIPLITIITICYNSEKTIENTIKSVLREKYDEYEYLIIDGASTDKTIDIIKKYAKEYPVIKYYSEPDKGISDAFNKGIKKANGKLICFINSDDELVQGTLNLVANEYKRTKADVIYGNTIILDEKNDLKFIKKAKDISFIKYELPFIHQSSFILKECYDKFGMYDENYKICMDYDLVSRLYYKGCSFMQVDSVFSVFRYGGTSSTHPLKTISENFKIARKNGLSFTEEFVYRGRITIKNIVKLFFSKIHAWNYLYKHLNRKNII